MKTGKDLYCKVHQSPRLPQVVLTPNLKYGRQDPPNPGARKSTDHHRKQSVQYRETCRSLLEDTRRKHLEESQRGKYWETCRGNVDYRIQGTPHSAIQKENSNRKEIVKRLIQHFENHPNRDSPIEDLNKTEEFGPFSEKSKEFITDMATRKSSSSTRPLRRNNALIALYAGKRTFYTAHAANTCSLQKGIDS